MNYVLLRIHDITSPPQFSGWWHHNSAFLEPGSILWAFLVPKLILLFTAEGWSGHSNLLLLTLRQSLIFYLKELFQRIRGSPNLGHTTDQHLDRHLHWPSGKNFDLLSGKRRRKKSLKIFKSILRNKSDVIDLLEDPRPPKNRLQQLRLQVLNYCCHI